MNGIYNAEEMLKAAMRDIDGLTLTGVANWNKANSALGKISAVIDGMKKDREAREKIRAEAEADAKKRREELAKEVAENGGELIGGETVHIDLRGGANK